MNKSKYLKFGIGLALGAIAGAGLYYAYQNNEDNLRIELVESVREQFSDREIDVVWLYDEAIRPGVFAGGLNFKDGESLTFEIEEASHKIIKKEVVE